MPHLKIPPLALEWFDACIDAPKVQLMRELVTKDFELSAVQDLNKSLPNLLSNIPVLKFLDNSHKQIHAARMHLFFGV